jgi:hypothetical protein
LLHCVVSKCNDIKCTGESPCSSGNVSCNTYPSICQTPLIFTTLGLTNVAAMINKDVCFPDSDKYGYPCSPCLRYIS